MQVQVNGEIKEISEDSSLLQLINQLDLPPQRIAVELNRAVVRRVDWPLTRLQSGDRIEVVHFVGGG